MPLSIVRVPGRRAAVALAGFAATLVVGACTSSSSSTVAPLTGNLLIDELQPAGGPAWKKGASSCVELGKDPGQSIAVVIQTDASSQLVIGTPNAPDWTLAPPLACVGTAQCGYIVLTVDTCKPSGADAGAGCVPDLSERVVLLASGPTISVAMRDLPNPTGAHRFHAQLLNSDGTVPVASPGEALADEVVVDVEGHCGAPSPGAPDAATPDASVPDAALDAGSDASRDGGTRSADAAPRDASADATADAARPHDAAPHD